MRNECHSSHLVLPLGHPESTEADAPHLPHPQKYKQLHTPLSITPPHIGSRPLSEVPPPWDLKRPHEVLTAVTLPAPGGVNKNERHLSKAPLALQPARKPYYLPWLKKKKKKIPGGPVVGNLPVSAGVADSIPVPGRFHKVQGN